MTELKDYQHRFRHIALERHDGVLEMRLHTDDGPLKWGFRNDRSVHAELGEAFYRIARDGENKVLILTGTGDIFLEGLDEDDLHEGAWDAAFWDRMAQEGRDLLVNYLDVGIPVISAVNGPVTFHPELPTMADVVVASENATFSDPHMVGMSTVPGDGAHIWWPMVLGPNRGRSFLLTGQEITAREALALGFVAEVVPQGQTLVRAREIAAKLAVHPRMVLRNARLALTQDIKRRMLNDLQFGFALEGLGSLAGN
jgi:enoyl-CoA hydratase/carnithine racemase